MMKEKLEKNTIHMIEYQKITKKGGDASYKAFAFEHLTPSKIIGV